MIAVSMQIPHIRYELTYKDLYAFFELAYAEYWDLKDVLTDMWYDERDNGVVPDLNIKAALETELSKRELVCDKVCEYIENYEQIHNIKPTQPKQGPK